jgi:hypothetical protein
MSGRAAARVRVSLARDSSSPLARLGRALRVSPFFFIELEREQGAYKEPTQRVRGVMTFISELAHWIGPRAGLIAGKQSCFRNPKPIYETSHGTRTESLSRRKAGGGRGRPRSKSRAGQGLAPDLSIRHSFFSPYLLTWRTRSSCCRLLWIDTGKPPREPMRAVQAVRRGGQTS